MSQSKHGYSPRVVGKRSPRPYPLVAIPDRPNHRMRRPPPRDSPLATSTGTCRPMDLVATFAYVGVSQSVAVMLVLTDDQSGQYATHCSRPTRSPRPRRIDPQVPPHPFTADGRTAFDATLKPEPDVFRCTRLSATPPCSAPQQVASTGSAICSADGKPPPRRAVSP